MIEDLLVYMLNMLSTGVGNGTDSLLQSPQEYNAALYNAALTIHSTAVKPITMIVLAIVSVLMLATTSTRAEGDRELGVRIIAAAMFKIALVFIVVQNAVLLLDAFANVATTIADSANNINVGTGTPSTPLGDALRADITKQGLTEKVTLVVLLLLPWLVSVIANVLAIVLVFIRFLQMYLLISFASLPVAFFGHEDTKSIGIGYLKGFAGVALTGTVIVISVKLYQALMAGWSGGTSSYDGNLVGWITGNFGNFFVAPIVLIFLMFGASSLAKKLVGEA